jgi:hypothetical protein
VVPVSAPVATLTSNLSHIVPTMLSLTVVASPAALNGCGNRRHAGCDVAVELADEGRLAATPDSMCPGLRSTPPT